jgi:hypothetical protein
MPTTVDGRGNACTQSRQDGPEFADDRRDRGRRQGLDLGPSIRAAADALADAFDEVDGEDWLRLGRRSAGASFTVESFARYLVHDPVHHLWDCGVRVHLQS